VADLEAWKHRLRERRLAFTEEDHGGQCSIYFSDPNGSLIELTQPQASAARRS
jgi:hypothetical protein